MHARPQAPQFESVASDVSQPSASFPLQSAKPGAQAESVHAPAVHDVVAFGALHALPQLPQFAGSVWRFVHAVAQTVLQNVMPTLADPLVETAPPPAGDIARAMLAATPDAIVTGVAGLAHVGAVVAFTALHLTA